MSAMHSGKYRSTCTDKVYDLLRRPSLEEDTEAFEIAVKDLTTNMRFKMHNAYWQGRNGWNRPALCPTTRLRELLGEAYQSGDLISIANYIMMLHGRGVRNLKEVDLEDQIESLRHKLETLLGMEIDLESMGESTEAIEAIRQRVEAQLLEAKQIRTQIQP